MTVDSSYVGRYGTLSLMKKDCSNIPVAHYPIDDEEITIGRDPNCSVRLYYDAISKLHCKVTFEDTKAFLTIYGTSGLVADGFPLFPTAVGPTTVPLANNTVIEIHHKRFIFTYPPKDLRAIILATPEADRNGNRRKTLRMSMIASAMVFTPRPSQDPRENLRTLQSPLRPNYSSPLKPIHSEEPEEDIVLVETNHPSVVQDDEDNLVILESVQAPIPLQSPRRFVQFTPQPHQYQTPRRDPRNSLHRAVLIRSAQRTAMKVEIQLEEEEMEVEDVVTELGETNLDDNSAEEDDHDYGAIEEEALEDEQPEEQGASEEEGEEENGVARPLGPFMTPQPSAVRASSVFSNQSGLSLQGPQRIRVVQPWKVKDIVVPPPSKPGVKQEDLEPKEEVSEEEKSAIRARRKSALATPDPADSRIPGSRRMSTILRPPPTIAPPVPPSLKKPFIKPDPNPPEEEEDTDVLLQKVKAKIEDLKRRQSIGLGIPPLERQRSRSPTKQDAEALFWGSDSVTSTRIDQMGDEGNGGMDHSHPPDEDEDMDDDGVEEQEVIRQTTPVKSQNPAGTKLPPKTPRMDGMKGLFANPRAAPPTPAMGGIKQLFNKSVEPQTPVYGGVRDMFKSTVAPVVPGTPVLECVRDLLDTPNAYREQLLPPELAEVSVEAMITDSEMVIPATKVAGAWGRGKDITETEQLVEQSVPPTTGFTQPLKIGRPKKALKEAVSLPRPTRTKKVVDEASRKTIPSSEPVRRTRADTAEAEDEEQPQPSQTTENTGSKVVRRTRRTPDVPSNPPPTRVTRGRTTPTPMEETETTATKKPNSSSNSRATPRRGTRNTPVPDDGQSEPAPALRKSARVKRVGTIKEEEDEATVPPQTATQKGTLTQKSQLPSRSRTATTGKESPTEKENEPSDSGDNSQSQGAPPTRGRRTAAKTPVVKTDVKGPKPATTRPTRVTRGKK